MPGRMPWWHMVLSHNYYLFSLKKMCMSVCVWEENASWKHVFNIARFKCHILPSKSVFHPFFQHAYVFSDLEKQTHFLHLPMSLLNYNPFCVCRAPLLRDDLIQFYYSAEMSQIHIWALNEQIQGTVTSSFWLNITALESSNAIF